MKRRYIALLISFFLIALFSIANYFFNISFEGLYALLALVAVAFKNAFMNLFLASKAKFLAFLKGLTLIQAIILLVKRWFLDNIFSIWLKNNILDPLFKGIKELLLYYKKLDIKKKIKNFVLPVLFTIFAVWGLHFSGYLDNLIIFTELKVVIIAISKTILSIGTKLLSIIFNSWLTPILEIFALSYLLTYLEKKLGKDNPIIKAINFIGAQLNKLFSTFSNFNRRYIKPLISHKVKKQSNKLSRKIIEYVNAKKIEYEYEQFEKLENLIIGKHIDAYCSFKDMHTIKDKQKLYSLINTKTNDHLNIIAYLSRDSEGNFVNEDFTNSFYDDIFILEGVASCHKSGVKKEIDDKPDSSDFWVLNTNTHPAIIKSKSGNFETTFIPPQSLTLIQVKKAFDYKNGDIIFEYNGQKSGIIVLEE
jgi:hypothetical protein